jgi:hypothetical protein
MIGSIRREGGGGIKKGDPKAAYLRTYARFLQSLDVLCLPALRSFDNAELNGLTFLQSAEAPRLNRGVVDENVLAVLAADETVALRVIEPLNCSLFHGDAYSFEIGVAAIRSLCEAGRELQGRNCCVTNCDQSSSFIIATIALNPKHFSWCTLAGSTIRFCD